MLGAGRQLAPALLPALLLEVYAAKGDLCVLSHPCELV